MVDLLAWGSRFSDPFKRKYCPPGLKVGVGCVPVRPDGPPRGGDPLLDVDLRVGSPSVRGDGVEKRVKESGCEIIVVWPG